jgi:repressor LexA
MFKQKLTSRQKEVLNLVNRYIKEEGISPTLSEMMEELNISTKKGVAFHLDALEKKGYITRTGGSRGILVADNTMPGFIKVPLLGFANAGTPLVLADEDYAGELTIEEGLLQGNRKVFGLEIKGDSMDKKVLNGIPLHNGNYAIVAKDTNINNGDVVLAVINEAATIKTFKKEGGTVVLYPESSNPNHKPIYMKADGDVSFINGKILTVLTNPMNFEAS